MEARARTRRTVRTGEDPILESALLGRMIAGLPRSPHQLNRPIEADAELLQLPGVDGVLVLKADGLVEELAAGLYEDPELVGWMAVTSVASDLAAVGAEPVGLLLAQTLPEVADEAWVAGLQRGVAAACRTYGFPVLGGDTARGPAPQVVALGVGRVIGGWPLTRLGTRPADLLYASGPLGAGNVFAFERLVGREPPPFRPRARLHEGRLLRDFATACMDTSDGALAALDQLGRLNGIGFELDRPAEDYLDAEALAVGGDAGLPPHALLAGQHGEFELVFTLRPEDAPALDRRAARIGWRPVPLGRAVPGAGVRLRVEAGAGDAHGEQGMLAVDAVRLRNLAVEFAGDPAGYVREVLAVLRG